jgi:hypothetical protein
MVIPYIRVDLLGKFGKSILYLTPLDSTIHLINEETKKLISVLEANCVPILSLDSKEGGLSFDSVSFAQPKQMNKAVKLVIC